MASRTAVASPVTFSADYNYQPTSTNRRSVPPVAPPRSSSNNHSGIDTAMASPSAASYREVDTMTQSQSQSHVHGHGHSHSQSQSSRSRRTTQQDPPPRTTSAYSGQQQQQQQQQPIYTQQQMLPPTKQPADHTPTGSRSGEQRTQEPLLAADQVFNDVPVSSSPAIPSNEDAANDQRRGGRNGGRNSGSSSKRDKNTKFNDYVLGNVIGEGEFGKVRLGWKQSGSSQVAIKIIKKESLGNNPARLSKIHREVNILRGLSHNNIVRLYDMISDDSRIGIVLEYASGGELFDYILRHRYLKDNNAKRLFAQLVSGVGYLHKKGIVHRDLKLENLLLDRNKNIIITDFGFANTFDADDLLTENEEEHLADRDYIKRSGLDQIKHNGHRRGDLMQTSCGSPCYAAPELVVSDCLYTGRKVDVWSCGVILYAMLAGYLPFDDDPANPEGDNINLLYKYIVNTTLTFPEYVSPHARDLLRRILVPDPRKRADLFEVARHSWLSDYESAVAWITSNTTSPAEVQDAANAVEEDVPGISRSASVREPPKKSQQTTMGGLSHKGNGDADSETASATSKAAKRRTVQVEYVAPATQTQRERSDYASASTTPKAAPGPATVASRSAAVRASMEAARDKPLPKDPVSAGSDSSYRGPRTSMPVPDTTSKPSRENRMSMGETLYTTIPSTARGSGSSSPSGAAIGRTGYSQPAPPAVAGTNVHGKIQQPGANDSSDGISRPNVPANISTSAPYTSNGQVNVQPTTPMTPMTPNTAEARGHRRSNTIGDIGSKLIGRSGSLFGRSRKRTDTQGEKNNRKYPPLSMSNQMLQNADEMAASRQSIESSRRSISFGLGKKRSGSIAGSQHSSSKSRRMSIIATFKNMGLGRSGSSPAASPTPPSDSDSHMAMHDADSHQTATHQMNPPKPSTSAGILSSHNKPAGAADGQWRPNAIPSYVRGEGMVHNGSDSSLENGSKRPVSMSHYQPQYPESADYENQRNGSSRASNSRGGLQKPKRGFTNAYGDDISGGAARRVMDFFRRRGKAREEAAGER